MSRQGKPSATQLATPVWWVYLVRSLKDGSLHCGITVDVERRIRQHNGTIPGGNRSTRAKRPVELAWAEAQPSRSAALGREASIKRMSRAEKLRLVAATTDRGEQRRGEDHVA